MVVGLSPGGSVHSWGKAEADFTRQQLGDSSSEPGKVVSLRAPASQPTPFSYDTVCTRQSVSQTKRLSENMLDPSRSSSPHGLPAPQGLYDPAAEHDACGVNFVVNLRGVRSHEIVQTGLGALCKLEHRGAVE